MRLSPDEATIFELATGANSLSSIAWYLDDPLSVLEAAGRLALRGDRPAAERTPELSPTLPSRAPGLPPAGDTAIDRARAYEALIGRRTYERPLGMADDVADAEIERLGDALFHPRAIARAVDRARASAAKPGRDFAHALFVGALKRDLCRRPAAGPQERAQRLTEAARHFGFVDVLELERELTGVDLHETHALAEAWLERTRPFLAEARAAVRCDTLAEFFRLPPLASMTLRRAQDAGEASSAPSGSGRSGPRCESGTTRACRRPACAATGSFRARSTFS